MAGFWSALLVFAQPIRRFVRLHPLIDLIDGIEEEDEDEEEKIKHGLGRGANHLFAKASSF